MISRSPTNKEIELNIVGSSTFGRYPKISQEKTYNMFISDGWMVPYAGYNKVIIEGSPYIDFNGRAIYTSNILNAIIAIWDTNVYLITNIYDTVTGTFIFEKNLIGTLENHISDIFIAENPVGQIVITDGFNVYVYDRRATPSFYVATTDGTIPLNFSPGPITYQNGRFVVSCLGSNNFRLSNTYDFPTNTPGAVNPVIFPVGAAYTGALNTKPDTVVSVLRVPSKGNMLYVFGTNVVEVWFDQGLQGFPYERSQSFNIDYGCINPSTIASNDEYVVWLAQNEKSGPIIVSSQGGSSIDKITTDGIDYLLSSLTAPQDSEGFMYRQDGHLFYHINFYTDNFSLFYDFNTEKFFHACDPDGNYFIAKEVAFYNNQYYFITPQDGNLYAFDTQYTLFNGREAPRYRVCKSIRFPTQERFIITDFGFTIEQGTTDYAYETHTLPYVTTIPLPVPNPPIQIVPITPRIDISISYDGGQSFSSFVSQPLNFIGQYKNILRFWQLGMANDFTVQLRYYGIGRFLATDGIVNVRS